MKKLIERIPASYIKLVEVTYILVFFEWLFFATKASFLSTSEGVGLLLPLVAPTLMYVSGFTFVFVLYALALRLLSKKYSLRFQISKFVFSWHYLPAALVTTMAAMLIIDNFTYTMFSSGIIRTKGHQIYVYSLGLVLILSFAWSNFSKADQKNNLNKYEQNRALICALLVAISIVFTGIAILLNPANEELPQIGTPKSRPNILFFASDGIDADSLSTYGYKRNTSPNLTAFSKNATFFAEAAISNAGRTTGSTTSMLTGQLPTTNKVIFPPHALTGQNSYIHLPGILKSLGYRSQQETVRYYTDSADLNMLNAFDQANKRAIKSSSLVADHSILASALSSSILLTNRVNNRINERLMHLSGQKKMLPDFEAVKSQKIARIYGFSDQSRIDRIIEFMTSSEAPFFAHVHLMDTHCCKMKPKNRIFSKGKTRNSPNYFLDTYDDAIIHSDKLFGQVINALKKSGKLDNTVVIYSSDHTIRWGTAKRVPLIMSFPGVNSLTTIKSTVQLLDVTPTILDYMGISVPNRMEGASLLTTNLNGNKFRFRPIFTVDKLNKKKLKNQTEHITALVGSGPPTYGLRAISLVVCQNFYELNFKTNKVKQTLIPNHPAPCSAPGLPSNTEAKAMLMEHLNQRGISF